MYDKRFCAWHNSGLRKAVSTVHEQGRQEHNTRAGGGLLLVNLDFVKSTGNREHFVLWHQYVTNDITSSGTTTDIATGIEISRHPATHNPRGLGSGLPLMTNICCPARLPCRPASVTINLNWMPRLTIPSTPFLQHGKHQQWGADGKHRGCLPPFPTWVISAILARHSAPQCRRHWQSV